MAGFEVVLTTSDGREHAVDSRILESSKYIQNIVNEIGLEGIQSGGLCLRDIDGNTLDKVLDWTGYHLHNLPPDDNAIDQRLDQIANSELNKEDTTEDGTLALDLEHAKNAIADMKAAAGAPAWRNRSEWEKIDKKRRELINLEQRYRQQESMRRISVRSKAVGTAYKEVMKKRNQIREWEGSYMDVAADLLFEIIKAAEVLKIPDLLDCSCKKAAEMMKDGSLKTLKGLAGEMQSQIIQNLCPHAFLRATNAKIVPASYSGEKIHAKIWASTFPNDTWFEAALAAGANPVLIGEDLRWFLNPNRDPKQQLRLILSPLDWEGDLKYYLPCKESSLSLRRIYEMYLQPGSFQKDTWTYRTRNITLYVGEECSHVDNMEQGLVRKDQQGNITTLLVHLRDPRIFQVTFGNFSPERPLRELRIPTNHFTRGGHRIEYPCFEYGSSC